MTQTIVGLLAVDPRHLYVYWDLPRTLAAPVRLETCPPVGGSIEVPPSGSHYLENVPPDRTYHVELHSNGRIVARSNAVTLPPEEPVNEQPPIGVASR